MQRCTDQRGDSLSQKRIPPLKPQEKGLTLQASSSKSCNACRLHFPARGIAAFSVAIRFASAPIIRCRSAHLVEVQPNFRLPPVSTMRRAQQAAFGKQSAAEQTSLAPHDSKARLRVVTTCRRFMAKPCTPHPHCAARVVLQATDCQCAGSRGKAPRLSLGDSKGVFSSEREYPLWCRGAHAAPPPALARENQGTPLEKGVKKTRHICGRSFLS